MSDHDDGDSEVERLARSINATGDAIGEAVGCVGRGCGWVLLALVAVELAFLVVGGSFEFVAGRVGPWPALALYVALGWLAVRAWRRHRAGGGGGPSA